MRIIKNWWVWVFPVLAAMVTGTLYYNYWLTRGPLIEISFSDASMIESQKTTVRFRGVIIGKVESVYLSRDSKQVLVAARLNKTAKGLAVSGTKFIIVQPQVDFEGVRGLETIFKGAYIRVEPGSGTPTKDFRGYTGNEVDPSTGSVVNFRINSRFAESLNPGDSIFYRGVKVGALTDLKINSSGQLIQIMVGIDRRYRHLIRKNTSFWQKAAIYAKAGILGAEVKINSLESVIKGGISFATPSPAGPIAPANTEFFLEQEPPRQWEKWEPELKRN